jgi:ABC-type phosphate transport system substrate-binding protein
MRPGIRIVRLLLCGLIFLCVAESRSAAKQMAVIVNQGNTAQDLTTAEITKIFKCDMRKWASGAAVTIVVRDPATPEMELLLSRIYRTTPEDLRSFIAAHKDSIVIVDSNEAMLNAVHNIPGAIGLVDVFLINKEVKVLKIDGKLPVEYGYILRGN